MDIMQNLKSAFARLLPLTWSGASFLWIATAACTGSNSVNPSGATAGYNVSPNGVKDIAGITTLTHLTLTGSIDIRDVMFMRNSMRNLTTLDLSSVTIAEYTDEEGIFGDYSNFYFANTMPEFAFLTSNSDTSKALLTSVKLPNNLISIDRFAFHYCRGLTGALTIPSSVKHISYNAFAYCTGLTSVINLSLTPQRIETDVFKDVAIGKIPLIVPSSSVAAYQRAAVWTWFKSITGGGVLLNVKTNNAALGSVEGIATGLYPDKTSVSLTATPAAGFSLLRWTGGVANLGASSSLSFSLTRDTLITAHFGRAGSYSVRPNELKDISGITDITHLTLTGDIDARDVMFMRDSMAALMELDLSGATMVEYTGMEGAYPANEMPEYSFSFSLFGDSHMNMGKTSLTAVKLPGSITSIGFDAFHNCRSLPSVTIPSSVTDIGSGAFSNCNELTSVTIPSSVKTIGDDAFSGCYSLTGALNIPDSVTTIGKCAFYQCASLTSVTIGNSVTTIGKSAFHQCGSLTGTLTIPNSVTTIDKHAFDQCRGLTGTLIIPNSVTTIEEYAFYQCSGLTSVAISNSVTTISSHAFSACRSLTSVTIPQSVTTIDVAAFSGCIALTDIAIPSSVKAIGSAAFDGCIRLNSVIIPNSVTAINSHAFAGCRSLTGITIPNSVAAIGIGAFAGCSGLASVTNLSTTPQTVIINDDGYYVDIFDVVDKSKLILRVPAEAVDAYKAADVWKDFGSIEGI
jgi:hypothetical protein